MMEQPKLKFVFEISIQVGSVREVGETGNGIRKIVPITGGTFEGPEIKGIVIPGGYDWQLLRSDDVSEIDARYVLQTDDAALITIVNKGLRHAPAAVMKRIAMGEDVKADEYYFRSIPVFETGEKKYEWLVKNVFIATGTKKPDKVLIAVWQVL
jgi:hypothetical protein